MMKRKTALKPVSKAVTLTPEDQEMLAELAAHDGVSEAEALAIALRERYRDVIGSGDLTGDVA